MIDMASTYWSSVYAAKMAVSWRLEGTHPLCKKTHLLHIETFTGNTHNRVRIQRHVEQLDHLIHIGQALFLAVPSRLAKKRTEGKSLSDRACLIKRNRMSTTSGEPQM